MTLKQSCGVFNVVMKQISLLLARGVRGGGQAPRPLPTRAPTEGGLMGGVLLILHLPQAIYILQCIALHSLAQTKIYSDLQQNPLNHCFPF